MNLKDRHTWAETRTQHTEVSKKFAADLLDFISKKCLAYGSKWLIVEGENKVFTSEELVDEYEKTL